MTYKELFSKPYKEIVKFKQEHPEDFDYIVTCKPQTDKKDDLYKEFVNAIVESGTDKGKAIMQFRREHPEEYTEYLSREEL